jgi:hypothetical protein
MDSDAGNQADGISAALEVLDVYHRVNVNACF